MKKHCLIYVFIVAFWIIASVFLIWQTVYISLPIFKSSNLLLWKNNRWHSSLWELQVFPLFLAKFD
mgnify:CR=1 FL=1